MTFIRGRYIIDGAVMLHEIVHELSRKKMDGVVLKIDFEKAYDSINWDFIEEVMERKGFNTQLKSWIMSTIKGGCVLTSTGRMGPISKHTGG
jgi:predicted phosphoadenosine phosphosulfate sulfurtransferase